MADLLQSAPTDALITAGRWSREAILAPMFTDRAEWLRARTNRACQALTAQRAIPKLRVFVDGGYRVDLSVELARSPMNPTEEIDDWVRRAIGQRQYCLAFNGITAWDEELAHYICRRFVAPVVRALGWPVRGFDVYVFAGRYPTTPFGIHTDAEPSILLQLGPAEKTALLWPVSEFRHIAGDRADVNEFDIAKWEGRASRYRLAQGDLLYIPVDAPHVMRSESYSVTLGIVPNPTDTKGLCVEVARELVEHSAVRLEDVSFLRSETDPLAALGPVLGAYGDWECSVGQALRRIRDRLESNGFLVPPPACATEVAFSERSVLRVTADYPIRCVVVDKRISVYARGHHVQLRGEACLTHWLSALRPGTVQTVADVVARLGHRLERSAIERIIETLLRFRALELVHDHT